MSGAVLEKLDRIILLLAYREIRGRDLFCKINILENVGFSMQEISEITREPIKKIKLVKEVGFDE